MHLLLLLIFLMVALGGCAAVYPTIGTINRLTPELDALLAPDAKIEKLADGFIWTEGPLWNVKGNFLLFDDIPQNTTFRWQEGQGVSIYLRPSGYTGRPRPDAPKGWEMGANGTTYDLQGRMVLCQHGDRRVARLEANGIFQTIAVGYQGKRLNSPNDVVVKSNGDVYFTDPIYGLPLHENDPGRELDFCGVYRAAADGTVTLLTKELSRPNGLAFSPDEKILYVTVSDPATPVIMAYPVKADGTLDSGKVFFDMTPFAAQFPELGLPDGMKIDLKGNIFSTGPNGIYIFTPGGKLLGTLATGDRTANLNWGEDGSTLYIAKNHEICRVRTLTRGRMPGA